MMHRAELPFCADVVGVSFSNAFCVRGFRYPDPARTSHGLDHKALTGLMSMYVQAAQSHMMSEGTGPHARSPAGPPPRSCPPRATPLHVRPRQLPPLPLQQQWPTLSFRPV